MYSGIDLRSPQGQVIPEQLHDESRVLVGFLRQSVEFSDSIIKSLLGELAGLVWRVEDLVVKD